MNFDEFKGFRQYYSAMRSLRHGRSEPEVVDCEPKFVMKPWMAILVLFIVLGIMCLCSGCQDTAIAQEFSPNQIANAIYLAENSKNHPYGIMTYYKHTTPRQACINTINHRLRMWNGNGDVIAWIGLTYSPPSVNPNWVRLVHYFLRHPKNVK